MLYEVFDGGDMVGDFDDFETACAWLVDAVERHRRTHPDLPDELALLVLSDDGRTRHGVWTYADLVPAAG